MELIREHNAKATIVTTPWNALEGKDILETIEGAGDLEAELMREVMEMHDDHEHCHHDHEHQHDHGEHEHHHDHDHGEHGHHHDHDHECCHHDHDHDGHEHHHHHHADEVFTSWGMETPAVYTREEIAHILEELDKEEYGLVLRAKGMVENADGGWIYFDYVPQESNVRDGKPSVTGKFCVIGSGLKEDKLAELFGR